MKILTTALILVAICGSAHAQPNKTEKQAWRFQSVNSVGLIIGQQNSALQVTTVNGLQHGSWFGGIGVGVDGYRLRSVPVFAELRKTFHGRFFAYTGAGANWRWQKDADVKQYYYGDKFTPGFFGEAGLGYTLMFRRHLHLLFSGGYSFKQLTEEGYDVYFYPPWFPDTGPTSSSRVNYNLHRLEIKMGVAF